MDKNNENKQQKQPVLEGEGTPKKDTRKIRNIISYVCLGVAVACAVALLVLTYCVF